MRSLLVLVVLCSSALAKADIPNLSPPVGSGSGTPFSLAGNDTITAVRLFEKANAYICGIQLKFGGIWTELIGQKLGTAQELKLEDDEHIIQISGKFHPLNYIYQLTFYTSAGRSLMAGQPFQNSFNMYTSYKGQQLLALRGRFTSAGITAIAAHWGTPETDYENTDSSL